MNKNEQSKARSEPLREKIQLRDRKKKSTNNIDGENKNKKMVESNALPTNKKTTGSRVSKKAQIKKRRGRRYIVVKKKPRNVPHAKKRKIQSREESDDDDEPLAAHTKKRKTQSPVIHDQHPAPQPKPQAKHQKGKKRHSPVWAHFVEVIVTVDGVDETYAKCIHCVDVERKYKVSHKSNRSTGNMRRHLKREHKDLTLQPGGKFIFSQENFRKALLKWIVISNQPFSVVEEDAFLELIQTLNPSAELVSDKTIKADLTAAYFEKVEEIKQQLKEIPGKISITMDMWSSKNVIPFLAIRAHWISSEWEYKSQLLDFAHVEGDHDGKTECRLFLECITRFEIPLAKVLAFTMDNGTPNDTFIACLRQHGIEIGIDVSVAENQIRCLAHILNLSVQDILNNLGVTPVVNTEEELLDFIEMGLDEELIDDEVADTASTDSEPEDSADECENQETETGDGINAALKKLRKLVRSIRKSTKRRQKLKQLCVVYDVQPLVPIIDICTRWNSTYAMIKRAQHLKNPLRALCLENNALVSLDLSESQWEELKSVETLLQKFDRATQLISMERHPTITSYLPVMNWLLDVLTSYVQDESSTLANAADKGLEKLLKYEPSIKRSKLPFIATFLDPALKFNYFKEHQYNVTMINEIKAGVSNYFVAKYEHTIVNENVEQNEPVTDELFAHIYKQSQKDSFSSEFERYLAFPLSDPKTNLLKYWQSRETELPHLSKMARDFMCIQATSVPVERDNSAGADIITPTRCSLIAPTIQATMCLRSWYQD